jgi:hypothetical protein
MFLGAFPSTIAWDIPDSGVTEAGCFALDGCVQRRFYHPSEDRPIQGQRASNSPYDLLVHVRDLCLEESFCHDKCAEALPTDLDIALIEIHNPLSIRQDHGSAKDARVSIINLHFCIGSQIN